MPTPGEGATESIRPRVDAVFERLRAGQLSTALPGPQSGWEMALPTGLTVTRSTLQEQAQPLIALGAPAVPSLLRWAHDESPALRYVALYGLEQITGERPQISYFAKEDGNDQLAQAVSVWWRWYEANAG